MPATEHHTGWRTGALLAGAAYAAGAAATTAFTLPADVMTGLPIVALTVLVVARWPLRLPRRPLPPPAPPGGTRPYRAWGGLLAALIAWELVAYFARGSRGAHPTLSSMADALDRHYGLKALAFFGWLCLGALIVVKGTPAHASETP